MVEIRVEIKLIQDQFTEGKYKLAYDKLHCLCRDNPKAFDENISQHAMSILAQQSELESDFELELGRREARKQEIRTKFERVIIQIIRDLNPEQAGSAYEDQALRMKEQRDMLRKSLMKIEDDLIECDCPDKIQLLETITKRLNDMIIYFLEIIKNLHRVKDL